MRKEVEEVIRKFYDDNVYISPTRMHDKWHYKKMLMKKTSVYIPPLVEEIHNRVSANIHPPLKWFVEVFTGCEGNGYDHHERVRIGDTVKFDLSWLGPFATSFVKGAKITHEVQEVLEDNNVIILSVEEVLEPVDWLDCDSPFVGEYLSVWNCLFSEL